VLRTVERFAEILEQLLQPPDGTLMSLDFALPAVLLSIFYELLFTPAAMAQSWSVGGRAKV
jgi:hypothetical protein